MINWLASYPKAGNTWVRIFLSAYIQDASPDINKLVGICSDQLPAAHRIGFKIKSEDVDKEHIILTRSMALLRIAYSYKAQADEEKFFIDGKQIPLILKTHVANVVIHGMRLIPPTITDKVVVIVRDPRDIVISYAKHFGVSIDDAIKNITDDQIVLSDVKNREKSPHHTTSWRNNVYLYAIANDLNITIVKYEQLKYDPVRYFSWILKWFDIPVDKERVQRAVDVCELSKMRKQEEKNGFLEASEKTEKFFGKGSTGGWIDILTEEQAKKIEESGRDMMIEFGYLEK